MTGGPVLEITPSSFSENWSRWSPLLFSCGAKIVDVSPERTESPLFPELRGRVEKTAGSPSGFAY